LSAFLAAAVIHADTLTPSALGGGYYHRVNIRVDCDGELG
jgi:hypothetical protein